MGRKLVALWACTLLHMETEAIKLVRVINQQVICSAALLSSPNDQDFHVSMLAFVFAGNC